MLRIHSRWHVLAVLLSSASAVQAQPAAGAHKPDPLDSRAAVPPQAYESAFAQYRRLSDEPVTSWREANDTVHRVGGWRSYAREATQPGAPAPASSSSPATPSPTPKAPVDPEKPAPTDHGSHKMN